MTFIETGYRGATKESYRKNSIRAFVKDLLDASANPRDMKAIVEEALSILLPEPTRETLSDDIVEVSVSSHEYSIANAYNALIADYPRSGETTTKMRQRKTAQKRAMKAHRQRTEDRVMAAIRKVTLTYASPTPFGPLGKCKLAELKQLGFRYAEIVSRGAPHQEVCEVITEAELRRI